MNKAKRNIIIIGIIVITIGGLFLFIKKRNGRIEARKVDIEYRKVIKTVSASGKVKSNKELDLSFPVAGEVTLINVEIGDSVSKGTLLAQVYNYDLRQTAESLRDSVDVAKKDKEIFIEDYATNVDGIGGADEYYIRLEKYDELIEEEEGLYFSKLAQVEKTKIRSPFSGTVLDISKEVGEVATAAEDIIKFADINNLLFEIELDQEDFGFVIIDQEANITLDAYEDIIINGRVNELPYFVDPSSEEFIIKIQIDQKDGISILLGMEGDVDIIVEQTKEEVNSLQFDAIFSDETGDFVYVVNNGILERESINIGLEGDVYTEILTDLSEKQIVVPTSEEFEIGDSVSIE